MKTPFEKPAAALLLAGVFLRVAAGLAPAQTFTNLHNFSPFTGVDGDGPNGGVILAGGTLFGTTVSGGSSYHGTVYRINTDGTGYAVLYSFPTAAEDDDYTDYTAPIVSTNATGYEPCGGLVRSGSVLYGAAPYGGTDGYGTIFAVDTNGAGFTVLHTFTAPDGYPVNVDGINPSAGLIQAGGTLYGTTLQGGSLGYGTVFAINTDGTGFAVLHEFDQATFDFVNYVSTNAAGAQPQTHLVLAGGTLYGSTTTGGPLGGGTIFSLATNGTGFTDLHDFASGVDGNHPNALTVADSGLFGTCPGGGGYSAGTIFSLATNGTGFSILGSFGYGGGGASPDADLLLAGNLLYGSTMSDASHHAGTIFAINTNGTGFNVIHTFAHPEFVSNTNSDGTYPNGFLLASNTLYGTAGGGGGVGRGTVFGLILGTGATNPPALGINLSGNEVVVTWPDDAGAPVLQSATNLTPPVVWSDVSPPPVVINGQNVVTNTVGPGNLYYRLYP